MANKLWRIKAEHVNEEGCFAYGGGVPQVEDPGLANANVGQMQLDPSLQQAPQQQMPTSVNPLIMLRGTPVPQPQIAPVEAPQAPTMAKTEQPQAPASSNQPATSSSNPYMAEALTQGNISREQVKQYDQAAQAQANIEADYTTRVAQLDGERNEVVKYLDENPVDASRFMQSQSTGGKVATAIGLILGGIGSGLQGGKPNVALEFLNKQIDNDIKAQIENRHGKENLLSHLERKYGDETTARAVLQSTLQTQLANKINKAALESGDQLAINRANQVTQQLMATASAPLQEAAKEQSFSQALQAGTDFSQLSPYMSEKQRARAVPGMGLARDEMAARNMNEKILPNHVSSMEDITQLQAMGIMDKFNPISRKLADGIQSRLMGRIREAIVGPGPLSDGDKALLGNIIANPTELFSLGPQGRLENLRSALDKDFAARAKGAGLSVPQQRQQAPPTAIKSFKPSK